MPTDTECKDLVRRIKHASVQRIEAEKEMQAANRRISAIAARSSRGRPRADSQSQWRNTYDLDHPVSAPLRRAYKAALERSRKAQSKAWKFNDDVNNLQRALSHCQVARSLRRKLSGPKKRRR